MNDNISAEEKLLEIIKKGADSAAQEGSAKKSKVLSLAGFVKNFLSVRRLRSWLPKIITAGFVFSLVFFLVVFVSAFIPPAGRVKPANQIQEDVEQTPDQPKPFPVEVFVSQISKKDIFNSAAFKKDSSSDISVDGVRNIGLLGIISEDPKQAIIKDKRTEEVYYLKEGESLGEFKLVQILEGKVIIEYRGERFEIYL
ncbi:MAG: hypothetical protein NTY14_03310 [Candidatus Omnitrophica bacterium]|nr:hypothetical protein [Candidatus Omnitrophota bacterium]